MVFYVYSDPEIISVAKERGQDSLQILVGIFRNFVDNCFLTEFEDYRIQDAIKKNVEDIPEDYFERKKIKTLLSTLQKRNRFIYCLTPDYSGKIDDFSIALNNAHDKLIDLFVIGNIDNDIECPPEFEITDLSNYQNTQFENLRSELVRDGKDYAGGELDEIDFLNSNYKKAFMYSTRLEICDGVFGSNFADNFDYTTKVLFRWLEQIHTDPNNLKIVFHCAKPKGHRDEYLKNRLAQYKSSRLSSTQIELIFYETADGSQRLPHDRYFITDQIAFQIGRGMDFLDRNTRKNRDTTIELKNPFIIEAKIEQYKDNKLPPIVI